MDHPPKAISRPGARALFGSWLTTALACLGVILPKCPLCAAAYLCLFGVSASTARAVVELGLPLAVALIVGSALATALFVARRGKRMAARAERAQSVLRISQVMVRRDRSVTDTSA